MKNTVPFKISVKGEISEETFEGVFEAKVKMSHREVLREDEIRRNVLGTNPADAGPYAASIASAVAYLTVRLVKAPDWFKESGYGLDLEDENVLVAVNNAAVAAIQVERDAHLKLATDAQAELKKRAEDLDS